MAGKRGLGRGLDALLGPERAQAAGATAQESRTLPVDKLRAGQYQPRMNFAPEALAELADSIKVRGIMQPIVVRPVAGGDYEIIAGERRWRAAQQAGLDKVPVLVREVDDESAIAMSLVENIQREDLNPLEEARALQRLIDEFGLSHQEVATAVGKSRSAVTNLLRLGTLSEPVANMLAEGLLDMGHARALLPLQEEAQLRIAKMVVSKGLSVRQTEELVKREGKPPTPGAKPTADADTRRLEEGLARSIGQQVQIRHTKAGKGKMTISYNSLDELDGILSRMGYQED